MDPADVGCVFRREQMLAIQRLGSASAAPRRAALRDRRRGLRGVADPGPRVRARSLAVGFLVLPDPNQDAARAWHVRVLPVSVVVAADGRPRYTVLGEFDWAGDEALGAIRPLLPRP